MELEAEKRTSVPAEKVPVATEIIKHEASKKQPTSPSATEQSKTTSKVSANDRSYLTSLAPELQLMIFDHLGPVASTCLGLTCRKLYKHHWEKHGKVQLEERDKSVELKRRKKRRITVDNKRVPPLHEHLINWMGPELVYDIKKKKFADYREWKVYYDSGKWPALWFEKEDRLEVAMQIFGGGDN